MKAVILGMGTAGHRLQTMLYAEGVEPVAVADPALALPPWEGCLREHAPGNLVVIASPTKFHAQQAVAAVLAGARAILIEKPVGVNAAEAAWVYNECAEHGVKAAVGCMWRFFKPFMVHVVPSLRRGSVVSVHSHEDLLSWPQYFHSNNEHLFDPEQGGGVLLTSAVHWVDLMYWLLGPVMEADWAYDPVNEWVTGVALHRTGSRGVIDVSWRRNGAPNDERFTLLHETHMLVLKLREAYWRQSREEMYARMVHQFVRWVEGDNPGDLCTVDQAVQVMELLDRIKQ